MKKHFHGAIQLPFPARLLLSKNRASLRRVLIQHPISCSKILSRPITEMCDSSFSGCVALVERCNFVSNLRIRKPRSYSSSEVARQIAEFTTYGEYSYLSGNFESCDYNASPLPSFGYKASAINPHFSSQEQRYQARWNNRLDNSSERDNKISAASKTQRSNNVV